MDDAEIIAAAIRGKTWAQEAFVDRYQAQVRALARRLAPSLDHADDLAQESFLSALANLGRWRGDAPVSAWLRGIVRNQSRLQWRALARRRRRERDDLGVYIEQVAMAAFDLDPVECAERRVALGCCLDQMNERLRRMLDMRHRQDLSCEAIGEAVGAKPGAVRTAICRAHAKLRECLLRSGTVAGERAG